MNELKNLTNVAIGKLGIYTRSQTNLFSQLFFIFMNYNIIVVQVRYIIIETKEVARIGHIGFLFPPEYSCGKRNPVFNSLVLF